MGGAEMGVTEATTNVFRVRPIRSKRTAPVAGSTFNPTRSSGSSAASIQNSSCLGWSFPSWCFSFAEERPARSGRQGPAECPVPVWKFGLVKRLSGLDLDTGEIKEMLEALGIALGGKGKRSEAAPPSWRPDITGPADLVEEVVRLVGVANVPATPMPRAAGVARPVLTQAQKRQRLTRRLLAARGLVEPSVVHRASARETVRRQRRVDLEQSDLVRARGHAALCCRADQCGAAEPATAACRRRAVEVGQTIRGATPEDQFVAAPAWHGLSFYGSGRHWSGGRRLSCLP
jgi:phenylalanyl-tRNA synthetase beta chain